jgi:hypothetical protein
MNDEPLIETTPELVNVLSQISFVNTVVDFKWRFEFLRVDVSFPETDVPVPQKRGWIVWVSFERPDTQSGKIGRGRGRDEIIWEGTTESGVVKTAWLLVELMSRHELMEGFRYKGYRIFNPHHSVLDLAKVQEIHDARIKTDIDTK